MEWQNLAGLIARHGLTTLGGILASEGVIDCGQHAIGDCTGVSNFVGGGMILLGVGWSWYQKRGKVLIDAALAKAKGLS